MEAPAPITPTPEKPAAAPTPTGPAPSAIYPSPSPPTPRYNPVPPTKDEPLAQLADQELEFDEIFEHFVHMTNHITARAIRTRTYTDQIGWCIWEIAQANFPNSSQELLEYIHGDIPKGAARFAQSFTAPTNTVGEIRDAYNGLEKRYEDLRSSSQPLEEELRSTKAELQALRASMLKEKADAATYKPLAC